MIIVTVSLLIFALVFLSGKASAAQFAQTSGLSVRHMDGHSATIVLTAPINSLNTGCEISLSGIYDPEDSYGYYDTSEIEPVRSFSCDQYQRGSVEYGAYKRTTYKLDAIPWGYQYNGKKPANANFPDIPPMPWSFSRYEVTASLDNGRVLGPVSFDPPLRQQCLPYPAISDLGVKAQCQALRVRRHYDQLCQHPYSPVLTGGNPLNPCNGANKIIRAYWKAARLTVLCQHSHNGVSYTSGGLGSYPVCLGWRHQVRAVIAKAKREAISAPPYIPSVSSGRH